MSASPPSEFEQHLRSIIASFARDVFAAGTPPDHDGELPLVFSIYSAHHHPEFKEGPLPASKSAIEALPTVTVTEEEECAICLTEYGGVGEAKEMPCKHKFHSSCIMKWLGIHGSCPVCRYEMPVDEDEEKRRRDGGVGRQHVMVSFMIPVPVSGSGRDEDMDSSGVDQNEVRMMDDLD